MRRISLGIEIQPSDFKTRSGHNDRVLYTLVGGEVHAVAARSPGEELATLDDIDLAFVLTAFGTVHGVCRLVASHDFELVTARRLRKNGAP